MDRRAEVTALLTDAGAGKGDAVRRLLPLVYEELRALARHHRWRWRDERAPGTLSLMHEAYMRLVDQSVDWESRAQFFYLASRAMRSVLVDNARHFSRHKRGGGQLPLEVTEDMLVSEERSDELVSLDAALARLEAADPRLAKIVECRFFGGLTIEEIAHTLQLSPTTVKRGWTTARAWLFQELHDAS